MTQLLRWLAPGEVATDLSERIDNGSEPRFALTVNAEESSIGSSTVTVRDPAGTFHIVGLNRFDVQEEDSISDDPFIYVGRFDERREKRGLGYLTGASRIIECNLVDLNAILSNYIISDEDDADRPSETHAARIAWLLGTDACALLTDDSLVLTTTSVTMPEYDYTGMSPEQVVSDCARASGYQHFVWFNGETEEFGLVYALTGGDWYSTDIRLSNVPSEVDESTTFYLGAEAELQWDPSRVASRVYARGDGIDTTRTNDATEDLFARRDVAMDFPTVRSLSVLNARTDRSLANDLDTETVTVKGSCYLPSTHASMFKAGMRFDLHATHLTGYQDEFVPARLLNTTHTLLTPILYQVDWEAEPLVVLNEVVDCENDLNEPFGTVTWSADSTIPYGAPDQGTPALVNDGDDASRTGYNGGYAGPPSVAMWESDLGSAMDVIGFVILSDWESSAVPSTELIFEFDYSDDGSSWTTIDISFVSEVLEAATRWRSVWSIDDAPINHRYWRWSMSTTSGGGFHSLGFVYTWCIVGTGE